MKSNGPQGKSLSDIGLTKALFVSPDPVAVDTASVKFFSQVQDTNLNDVQYLAMGEKQKVGTMNIDKINMKKIKL